MQINEKLFKKLKVMFDRYNELENLLSDPEIISDNTRYTSYVKEHGRLSKFVGKYLQLDKTLKQKEEARTILSENNGDADLYNLAKDELDNLEIKELNLFEEVKGCFFTENEDSDKNAIMEIRAGTGGEEAALFASDLFKMYTKYAEKQNWKTEILDCSHTEIGGFKEVIFSIEGRLVYNKLRYESGTHRVQRVPTTETSGRIHTSAATVAVLPEIEDVEIKIDPKDVIVDTFRASGPGGQKVNKTSSAVRITHEPTGLIVKCMDEKSQHRNRAKAMRILRSRLYSFLQDQNKDERDKTRRNQIGSGDRSEKIRTYNYPQNRVTDHRINLNLYSLDKVMLGEIDELIEAMTNYGKEEKIKELAATL
ncbi:MAG: peptide chain release factor [Candidatus Scalindua rubra]|uniref:Peptide chain release factor 1 n=1 Tax=Candidatus Scalindua rubra TaxID=1872076 RepID=A0A1E3X9F9_9BACT|nr:MAG: peptide chain release factor [Candidatus Scalindua rubra]